MRLCLTPRQIQCGDWDVARAGESILVRLRVADGARTDEYTLAQARAVLAACDKDAGALVRFAVRLQEAIDSQPP